MLCIIYQDDVVEFSQNRQKNRPKMARFGQKSRIFWMTKVNFPDLYLEVLSTIPDLCGVVRCATEQAFQRPASGSDWLSMLREIGQTSV